MSFTFSTSSLLLVVIAAVVCSATANSPRFDNSTIIPEWHMSSTANISNVIAYSHPGANVSSWYHNVSGRSTIFAGLLSAGQYNETTLFYSDNLQKLVDTSAFTIPWLFRHEFELCPQQAQHIRIRTNGITSRADIYLNGHKVADSNTQVGAYGGHEYDITKNILCGSNALLIAAYPTDYQRDFAIGFVDWNPSPPDNGTGPWRHVELVSSGAITISKPRIVLNFGNTSSKDVSVVVKTDLNNVASFQVPCEVTSVIYTPNETVIYNETRTEYLENGQTATIIYATKIENPEYWWPVQWGEQPLYRAKVSVSVNGTVSAISEDVAFGIRSLERQINQFNDTQFVVNGLPFLALGAGYTPDIFLRFDIDRLKTQFKRVLDIGMNTIRLEGKLGQPEMYDLADEMGIMILAGWECCDKWEAWPYDEEPEGTPWTAADYQAGQSQMLHEAAMMQNHPSMLGFVIGSDFSPDPEATQKYLEALTAVDWPNPVIASVDVKSPPNELGPTGMKEAGPYDYVPPNYWYADQQGAAFGFGAELGAGVGTPEKSSLSIFLSPADMQDLWQSPDKGLYHQSIDGSIFHDRSIYNQALFNRSGTPVSLDDYLWKAQVQDYEATRAQFEAHSVRMSDERPATGMIYWMLNSAWPSLHWQLFDYYLQAAGAYFGAKVGGRPVHVVYNYKTRQVSAVNRGVVRRANFTVTMDLLDHSGAVLLHSTKQTTIDANSVSHVMKLAKLDTTADVVFVRLLLHDYKRLVSRNVYWIATSPVAAKNEARQFPVNEVLDWNNTEWYYTPVSQWADYTSLFRLDAATLECQPHSGHFGASSDRSDNSVTVLLENKSQVVAFFVRLTLMDENEVNVASQWWSDNYLTMFPGERVSVNVTFLGKAKSIAVAGVNVNSGMHNITMNMPGL